MCSFIQAGGAVGRLQSRRDDQGQDRTPRVGMDIGAGKGNVWGSGGEGGDSQIAIWGTQWMGRPITTA